MTDNNELKQLELEQMHTYAEFLEAFEALTKVVDALSNAAPYLNFTNPEMIQKYYNSLFKTSYGFSKLTEGFYEYSGSNNIDLEEPTNNYWC